MQSTERVTCFTAVDLAQASIVRSLLEDHGIACTIPDENIAGIAWQLSQAVGGVRVQVAADQLDAARELLAAYEESDSEGESEAEHKSTSEDAGADELTEKDRLASRSLKVAVVGLLMPCVVLQLYSLHLLRRAAGCGRGESIKGKAVPILVLNLLGLALVALPAWFFCSVVLPRSTLENYEILASCPSTSAASPTRVTLHAAQHQDFAGAIQRDLAGDSVFIDPDPVLDVRSIDRIEVVRHVDVPPYFMGMMLRLTRTGATRLDELKRSHPTSPVVAVFEARPDLSPAVAIPVKDDAVVVYLPDMDSMQLERLARTLVGSP